MRMIWAIVASAALPNLHPAVVHFPVALLVVALALDVVWLVGLGRSSLHRAAAAAYVLGAAGAGCAYLTGRRAENGLGAIAPAAQALLAEHADWALWTLILFAVLAAWRALLLWRDRSRPSPMHFLAVGLALFGQWVLFETADRGGALV